MCESPGCVHQARSIGESSRSPGQGRRRVCYREGQYAKLPDKRGSYICTLQAKLVKQEQQAIDAQHEKKRKGSEVSQKMYVRLGIPEALLSQTPFRSAHSTLTNKSRLKLLHLREQNLQDLFQTSRDSLASLSSSPQYVQFLQGVIVQGFLQLLEPEVAIHVRENDADVATEAAKAAAEQYQEISGREVKFEVLASLSSELYAFTLLHSWPANQGRWLRLLGLEV